MRKQAAEKGMVNAPADSREVVWKLFWDQVMLLMERFRSAVAGVKAQRD